MDTHPEHPAESKPARAPEPRSMVMPLVALAAGSVVALLVGVFGAAHDPSSSWTTSLGFASVFAMKVYFSVAVGVLAFVQVAGALWIYGRLGIRAPSWLGMAHRTTGAVALLLALVVAYHCLWQLGLRTGEGVPLRVVAHGILGCVVIGALVVKVFAVRSHRAPGWFLPVAGGLLFAALIGAVWTSAIWYVGEFGFPDSTGF